MNRKSLKFEHGAAGRSIVSPADRPWLAGDRRRVSCGNVWRATNALVEVWEKGQRWFVGLSVGVVLAMTGGQEVLGQTAPGVGKDVCARTYQVSDAIVAASGSGHCADVTLRGLREITSLDLSNQGISSLSEGDFDGLVRLDMLDLSGNFLTALPGGVFDELLLLRTVRLDGNQLQRVSTGVFNESRLLQELTVHGNPLVSSRGDTLQALSRLGESEEEDHVDLPAWAVDAGSLDAFLDGVHTVEEFIAALPALYKERFAMVFTSESPARDHVSGDYPRIASWGADGRFTFAWNTDPAAPSEFRDVVEFLRRGETDWTAGIVDFSGATPTVTEPASCKTCHGSLNKPLWGAWNTWEGTEFANVDNPESETVRAAVERALESTDPRIEPLDFEASYLRGRRSARRYLQTAGYDPSALAVEEAGAVWSWRHAEVLHRKLKASEADYWRFAEAVLCEAKTGAYEARYKAINGKFPVGDHNLAVLANTGEAIQGGDLRDPWVAGPDYAFGAGGELGGAVIFLMVVDLWQEEPIVRWLYRDVSNADTLRPKYEDSAYHYLYYEPGSATAEDELIQKLRMHFGKGSREALAERARQNARLPLWAIWSAYFFDGHLDVMAPRVCDTLRNTRPTNLRVKLIDGDAVLSWDEPEDIESLIGYRILRGLDAGAPSVHVEDTGTTDTTWTDDDPLAGDYAWMVQALHDGYASQESNEAGKTVSGSGPRVTSRTSFTVVEGDTTVGTLTATDDDTPVADLAWSMPGGPDRGDFTLSASGVLVFTAAKDYEAPDDTDADGTYQVTVQVSDGTGDETADIRVSLSNRNEAPTADAGADQSGIEEGATVSLRGSGQDPDAGDTLQYAWTQTGGVPVVLSAPSEAVTTFAAPTGLDGDEVLTFTLKVSDAGALAGEDMVTVTVVAAEEPALTAAFQNVPESHDGATAFNFRIAFSEEIGIAYREFQNKSLTVSGGDATAAHRVDGRHDLWEVTLAPDSSEAVTVALPGDRACGTSGAVCTRGDNPRPLTNSPSATVAGPPEEPLTASFSDMPAKHGGDAFNFGLTFSEEPHGLSYRTLRDEVFNVTGGSVRKAKRRQKGSNLAWAIRVRPDGNGAVEIGLPATTNCGAATAICTADGRPLSNTASDTVEGS